MTTARGNYNSCRSVQNAGHRERSRSLLTRNLKALRVTSAGRNSSSNRGDEHMGEQEESVTEDEDEAGELPKTKELTLALAQLRYHDEENRRTAVEGKIGTIITVDALIISIGGIFSERGFFVLLSMGLALLSVFIGLWALRTRDYNRPGKDIDDFVQYEDMEEEVQRKMMLFDYIVALDGNEDAEDPEDQRVGNKKKNDRKYLLFDVCVALTALALALILVMPALEFIDIVETWYGEFR